VANRYARLLDSTHELTYYAGNTEHIDGEAALGNDLKTYKRLRPNLVTGDLIQWRGNYPFSRIIRLKTGEYENHTSMVIRLQLYPERVFSIEALAGGLHLWPLSDILSRYDGHANLYPIKQKYDDAAADAARWMLAHLGTGYDFQGCASNWRTILGFKPEKADAKQLYCSESVFLAFKERKLDPMTGLHYGAGLSFLQGVEVTPVPGMPMLKLGIWKTASAQMV